MARYTWTGNARTSTWDQPQNWQPQGQPSDGDDVYVVGANAAGVYPSVPESGVRLGRLELGADAAVSGGEIAITEALIWAGGTVRCRIRIEPSATASIEGESAKILDAVSLTNRGALTCQRSSTLIMAGGAMLKNHGRCVLSGGSRLQGSGASAAVLESRGVLVIGQPDNSAAKAAEVVLDGVSLQSQHQLRFDRGVLRLAKGEHIWRRGCRLTGAGKVVILDQESTVALDSVVTMDRDCEIELGGQGSLSMTDSGNTKRLDCDGTFTFTGGVLAASLRIEQPGQMRITGSADKDLSGAVIENRGRVACTGTGQVRLSEGAKIVNRSHVTLASSAPWTWVAGEPPMWNNHGELIKTRSAARLPLTGVRLINRGSLVIESGVLSLDRSDYVQLAGETRLVGATLASNRGIELRDGALTGTGTLAATLHHTGGVLHPGLGDTAGELCITGDYRQGKRARLLIHVVAPGAHGRLVVTGTADMRGSLQLGLGGGSLVSGTSASLELVRFANQGSELADAERIGGSAILSALLSTDAVTFGAATPAKRPARVA